jgi:hypothetical protein
MTEILRAATYPLFISYGVVCDDDLPFARAFPWEIGIMSPNLRPANMIDDENVQRSLCRFQF